MNNRHIKSIQSEQQSWTVFKGAELKDVQGSVKHAYGHASRTQLIELNERLLKGPFKAEFEGRSACRQVLTDAMEWVTEINNNIGGLDKNIINKLFASYQIDDIQSVCSFLGSNTSFNDFLEEVASQIRLAFGDDVDLILRTEGTDPSETPYLFVSVITTLPVEEALNKVDEIDQRWLLDNLHRVQGRFNFDVEWK